MLRPRAPSGAVADLAAGITWGGPILTPVVALVMPPIILGLSDSKTALVQAIARASRNGVPLLLKPGKHFTQPGRQQKILIGSNGLRLSVAPPPFPVLPKPPAVIKRPDNAINLHAPDENFGLFFIPSTPTVSEVAGITWKSHHHSDGRLFEFGIVIRGNIEIDGVMVDCNMGRQGLSALPNKSDAEHSAMLGFAGHEYSKMLGPAGLEQDIPRGPANIPRVVYVGFRSVVLRNMVTANGGFADDVWISRGYFNPNIERVVIEKFSSLNRVSPKRATITFSGVCQTIEIKDVDIYKLEMEDDTKQHFNQLPRQSDQFTPSKWELMGIKAERIGLAAKGKVYVLKATDLTARKSFTLYQAGGSIMNSTLAAGDGFRLFRLNDFVFDGVTWQFKPDKTGTVHGLRPTSQNGDPCNVTFRGNVFKVAGHPTSGQIINSKYSGEEEDNRVTVSLTGCTYPEPFGRSVDMPIAKVKERGHWTFIRADLGTREPDVGIQEGPQSDIDLHII